MEEKLTKKQKEYQDALLNAMYDVTMSKEFSRMSYGWHFPILKKFNVQLALSNGKKLI